MIILQYKRIPNIIQAQIDDYIGPIIKHVFKMNKQPSYRKGIKMISLQKKPKPRGRPRKTIKGTQSKITDYFISLKCDVMKPAYLKRFPKYLRCPTEIGRNHLTPEEQVIYWEVRGFQGFFDDLFLVNDLSCWSEWETYLESQDLMRSIPNLHDMFIYECLRINLGIEQYSQFWRIISSLNPMAIMPLLEVKGFIPKDQDFSDFYSVLPVEAFEELFHQLVWECFDLKLISSRILLWDCQFIHSNASDYKSKKAQFYSDKDAGLGVHNNKFLGVGYMASTLYAYCGEIIVPVFCMLFPANINDTVIFSNTIEYYLQQGLPRPLLILGDAGAYSIKNLRYLASHGIIGMINGKKNIKNQNIVKITDDIYINRDFIPSNWTNEDCHIIYNIRSAIERLFSHITQVYHARRLNVRGIEQAAKHRYMIMILDCLKVLTCYKLGRGDLFQTYTAFSQMRYGYTAQYYRFIFHNEGFKEICENMEE